MEIDHLLTAEHLKRINLRSLSPSTQAAVERARRRRAESGGAPPTPSRS